MLSDQLNKAPSPNDESYHSFASNLLDVALHLPRYLRENRAATARGMALLKFVGLDALSHEEARNLPYGKQRLLEIARALALDPQLLLLDEPAAGLTAPDIKDLIAIIGKIRGPDHPAATGRRHFAGR